MTLFGFVLGFAIFIGAILHETHEATLFINPHGLLIVGGGSLAAAFAGFHGGELVRSFRSLNFIFRKVSEDPHKYVQLFEGLAQKVSMGGLSTIEEEMTKMPEGFAKDGLDLLVNGFKREELIDIIDTRIETMAHAEQSDANLFRTMSTLAPGFGLVGTLIGLIIMLTKLEDVSKVAPSMATAMTATFYGVILANLIFLPLSVKISRRLDSKLWLYELIKAGVIMLYEKRHPLYVREKLGAFLDPGARKKLMAAASAEKASAGGRKPAPAKA